MVSHVVANGESLLYTSEEIQCTLCAFSQFSAYGVSTSSSRMGTSWELVLLTLDPIRLVANPQIYSGLSRSLCHRDAYIRLVVSRCLILQKRWCWQLDDDASSALFRHLVDIFKSHKFANLQGEIASFAVFVQESDTCLLMEDANMDSAFMIFLKLIFASTEQMRPTLGEDEYLGRTKKLLSLVMPVGTVQLSTLRLPFNKQLSVLYNRFSSLALTIRILLSAENVLYRVSLAWRHVDFGRFVAATCSVYICATNFLALQALDMALPVGPVLKWTFEIVQVLILEFCTVVSVDPAAIAAPLVDDNACRCRTELIRCTQLLLSGFHHMSYMTTTPAEKDTGTALELLQKGTDFSLRTPLFVC